MAKMKTADLPDMENARVLADMIADPETPANLRIRMINRLVETKKDTNFFKTIYEQKLSFGKCPSCEHENHWLVPEVELNKMGWVTSEVDKNVSMYSNKEICDKWEQACSKKKVTV